MLFPGGFWKTGQNPSRKHRSGSGMSRQPLGARAGPASFVLPSTNIALRRFHQSSQLLTPRPLPCLLPPFCKKQGTKHHRAAPLLAARLSPGTDKGGCGLLQHSPRTGRAGCTARATHLQPRGTGRLASSLGTASWVVLGSCLMKGSLMIEVCS